MSSLEVVNAAFRAIDRKEKNTCIICHNRPAVAKGLCITCAAQYGDTGQKPSEIAEENQIRADILAEIAERNRRDRL